MNETKRHATPFDPLAERIESALRNKVTKRVDDAMNAANDAAAKVYSDMLRAGCGVTFDTIAAEVMDRASYSMREAAIAEGVRLETAAALKRIVAEESRA